jgi:lysophospholipase L1-like esterase
MNKKALLITLILLLVVLGVAAALYPRLSAGMQINQLATTATQPPAETVTEPATEPVTEAPTGPITVVCVGDSITEGVGVTNRSVDSYPAQLQKLLGDGYKVVNCGKSKATALDTSSKYHNTNGIPYRTTTQYTAGLRAEPDVVLIMLGTNDAKHVTGSIEQSLNDYYDALKAIGEKFAALESKPKIYIVASPYRYEDSVRKANMDSAIIPTQKKLADDMGWGYIDLFTPTKEAASQNIHSDKLHLRWKIILRLKIFRINVKYTRADTCFGIIAYRLSIIVFDFSIFVDITFTFLIESLS